MSTVVIRTEVNAHDTGPRRPPRLTIDGERVGAQMFHVDFNLGGQPLGTWTLYVDGAPVMATNDQPERRYLDGDDAGMVEWTWRNVEVRRIDRGEAV